MAFKRMYKKGKRPFKRRGNNAGVRALRMARYMRRLMNVEYKYIDTTPYSGTVLDTTGLISHLSPCATGTSSTTRNGNSILAKSISIKAVFSAGTISCRARMILFLDKVSNGALPAITDLLLADTVISRYNDDNAGSRFIILADKVINLGFFASTGGATPYYSAPPLNKTVSIYKKLRNHIKYDGTSTAIADVTTGHYYLYVVCERASASGAQGLQATSRLMFIDN